MSIPINYPPNHPFVYNPGITICAEANREVLRITPDGRMILGEGLSQDEATQATAKALVACFEQQFEAARKDSERLDWLESSPGSVYASVDCETGKLEHFVGVSEKDQAGRRGCVEKTVRDAIDAAREANK